jgi:hypothetical protein
MIDFVKGTLEGLDIQPLEQSKYLNWHTKVECEDTDNLGKFAQSRYKGLLFRIFFPTEKRKYDILTIEGSLHKYWNNGQHNFNDFNSEALDEVLEELNFKFGIRPQHLFLTQLETGVNANPKYKTELILNCCLMHKRKQFKWTNLTEAGNYIQANHSNLFVKIYDKRLQYSSKGFDLKDEIMRFELKMKRPYFSRVIGKSGRITLQDILDFGLENFKTELLTTWDNILFYDPISLDETEYADRYSNFNFWNKIDNYQYRYHRENLRSIIKNQPLNMKDEIRKQISLKIDSLTTLNEPYNII